MHSHKLALIKDLLGEPEQHGVFVLDVSHEQIRIATGGIDKTLSRVRIDTLVVLDRVTHLRRQQALVFMFLLDQFEYGIMTGDALALERVEEIGYFLVIMKSIRISSDEIYQLDQNVGRNVLSPGEPGADAIKRSQTPFDNPVFVFQYV
jgi:hypothetical protein